MRRPRVTVAEFIEMPQHERDSWLASCTPGEIAAFNNELIPDDDISRLRLVRALVESDQIRRTR